MKAPESVLKKQATQAKIAEAATKAAKAAKNKKSTDKKKFIERAEKYAAEYAAAEKEAAKKVMQLFRLRQIHNATFVRLNEATIRMLRLIEPYVTYGYPTRATVEKLLYKRGFGKVNKQRTPIAENSVIETVLGKMDICCAADLVHEIITVGPNFKQANNFLWPFKLSSPVGGFSSKTKLLHFLEGGEAGARGEEINKLVKKML
eukprot:scaffold28281_cov53-Attheya_sp.AAC.4